ncbi:MAG: cell division protein FtsL [Gammaproteobacteria bacterium]|nr:cell division protein FtsL [Gammaproteobacteria bacterium]
MSRNSTLGILFVLVLVSALAVIYVRHESRNLFSEMQRLEITRDEMNVEWGQLQIEQSTYATHGRIERFARRQLDMRVPALNSIRMVQP